MKSGITYGQLEALAKIKATSGDLNDGSSIPYTRSRLKSRSHTELVTGKLFVCVKCEAIYRDEPVTCCDCCFDAKTFIEGTYSYPKPKEK